jgi:hypothetical protein
MIENRLKFAPDSRLAAIEIHFRHAAHSDWGFRLLRVMFVGLAVALMALWMAGASLHLANDPNGQAANCKSVGKGGLVCAPISETETQPPLKQEVSCAFHYRAGVSCPGTATK